MPVPEASQNLRRALLRDDAYEVLRADIISGALRPGERLHAETIAGRLGVSRTPIHEALGKLAGDGFVEVRPQKETRVASPSRASVADALFVYRHITLSKLTTMRAKDAMTGIPASATPAHTHGLLDVCAVLTQIIDTAQNQTLGRAARAIVVHLQWAMAVVPDIADELGMSSQAYGALVSALAAGDAKRAEAVIREWSDPILEAMPVRTSPAPVTSRILLRDQVYESILEALANGTLTTGERLREDHLMRWLGVSRTPVREALSRLERIGMVEVLPGRQTLVSPLNAHRLSNALRALAVFSDLAMRHGLLHLQHEDRRMLLSTYARMEQAAARNDIPGAVMAFGSAQMIVADGSGSKALKTIVDSIAPWLYKRVDLALSGDPAVLHDHAVLMQEVVQRTDGVAGATATSQLLRKGADSFRLARTA